MKILIHSNAPNVKTGYGVQCALLAERLHDAGHEVAVSATYGQRGSSGRWKPDHPRHPELWEDGGIRVYQEGWEQQGNDIIHNHAMHFFGGDPLGGWIIPLLDMWALVNPTLEDFNVAAWAPVDHFPVPPGVLQFFNRTGAVPVAMSRFGAKAMETAGLTPYYAPLAVDLNDYKPSEVWEHPVAGSIPGKHLMGAPDESFVVGMVAMNKDANDRKGFNEAFAAFGAFWRRHQDAVLYVHTDPNGMGSSFSLHELAQHCGIPPHAIVFPDIYAYQTGFSPEMMAAIYSGMDVLLAPSHGEGFCVPLIEAQACGTPVIVTDFSAQPELVGAGWKVMGQQQWDPAQHAFYIVPFVTEIVQALEESYYADLDALAPLAMEKAAEYDADLIFEHHWRPLLERMDAKPEPLDLVRDEPFEVAVIVPLMRPENLRRLVDSFLRTSDGTAALCVVTDEALPGALDYLRDVVHTSRDRTTYAEKVNLGLAETTAPWVLLVGDDVEFHEGWLSEAAKLADRFDVIGTNDSLPMSTLGPNGYELVQGRVRNPEVAAGKHADHFFVRRSYVEKYGACLDGPGVLAPECYRHWFVDKEIVELAKARGVFSPCLTSVVEHHHPGYDGQPRDDIYQAAIEHSGADQATFVDRLPLIDMQRSSLGKR